MPTRITLSVLIFSLTLAVGSMPGCGGKKQDANSSPGRVVFESQNCILCHGSDGTGKEGGPDLRAADRHFSKDQLITYLRDPEAYAKNDARLSHDRFDYPMMMPSFDQLNRKQLSDLADYVLSLQ